MAQPLVPRYHEIERALRLRVDRLAPGDALPSDAMLCDEFGVSRMTARGAMQALVRDGLAVREPGRGTFVAEPRSHRHAAALPSFTLEMRRRGHTPTSRLLRCAVREPSAQQRADLALLPAACVVEVRRLVLDDRGRPIERTESRYVPGRYALGIDFDVVTAAADEQERTVELAAEVRTP